jgi:predicted Zn finger-like uncharacterized protein
MYTQCNHCKAIFRVTMKELTAAQGLLRCGECDTIFDAMKTLSTTLPEERRFAQMGNVAAVELPENSAAPAPTPLPPAFQNGFFSKKEAKPATTKPEKQVTLPFKKAHKFFSSRAFLSIGIAALVLLLLLQVLYSSRNWLAQQPMTANLTRQACQAVGCEIRLPRDVSKINLLSRNVYSHPNTPGILTISVSIQNEAVFAQPYPLIEISFLDKENNVVALRRFTPEEYIKDFNGELMQTGIPDELVLNISDPGQEAVRFQFRFM